MVFVEFKVMVHKYKVVQNLIHPSDFSFSIGHPSWFNILETDEYLEKSFNTNLAALLWTISSLEILCSVDGDHTGEAYSRTDLTIDM